MDNGLKSLNFTFVRRILPRNGTFSADDWNNSVEELATDEAFLSKEWNTKFIPLLSTIPAGEEDTTLDAFSFGLDGRSLWVDSTVTSTSNDLTYYDITNVRPVTVKEAFDDVYEQIDIQLAQVKAEIVSTTTALTADQKVRIGSNVFDSSAASSATSLDGKSENNRLNTIQLAKDIYDATSYSLDNDGSPNLTYSVKDMVDALLALHNGAWNSDIVVDHSSVTVTVTQPDINSSAPGDDTFAGVPLNLEEDLDQIRTRIKTLGGTAGWQTSLPALYTAGADSLKDLLDGTAGTGTKSATNPWGYSWNDLDGLEARLNATNTFVGQGDTLDALPTYSSTNFVSAGQPLELAISVLDSVLSPVSGYISALAAFVGQDDVADSTPDYSSTININSGDSLEAAIGKLDAAVSTSTLVSVKAYGAIGDGVTDDTTAIQTAINYVCSGLVTSNGVYFPAGDYLTNRLGVFADNVTLRGEGKNISKLISVPSGDLSSPVLWPFDGVNAGLINVYPSGYTWADARTDSGLLRDVTIMDLGLQGAWPTRQDYILGGQGVLVDSCDFFTIKDCHLKDFSAETILVGPGNVCNYPKAQGNKVEGGGDGCGFTKTRYGIATHNVIVSGYSMSGMGVNINGGICAHNVVVDAYGNGIWVGGWSADGDKAGICYVTDNQIIRANTNTAPNSGYGIFVNEDDPTYPRLNTLVVKGNIVYQTRGYNGIVASLRNVNTTCIIEGNHVSETEQRNATDGVGIYCDGSARFVLRDNVVLPGHSGNQKYGIEFGDTLSQMKAIAVNNIVLGHAYKNIDTSHNPERIQIAQNLTDWAAYENTGTRILHMDQLLTTSGYNKGDLIINTAPKGGVATSSGIAAWHCAVAGNGTSEFEPIYTIDGVPETGWAPVWSGISNKASWEKISPVTDYRYYSDLAAAISAIGSEERVLLIPEGYLVPITVNTEIPINITLRVEAGARFQVATGVTLTISGPLEAGPYQIFDLAGTGTVYGIYQPCPVYPHWWGVTPNNVAIDNAVAIHESLTSFVNCTVDFAGSVLYFTQVPGFIPIVEPWISRHITLLGHGAHLISTADQSLLAGPLITLMSAENIVVDGLTVSSTDVPNIEEYLLSNYTHLLSVAGLVDGSSVRFAKNILVKNCHFSNGHNAGVVVSYSQNASVENCTVENCTGTGVWIGDVTYAGYVKNTNVCRTGDDSIAFVTDPYTEWGYSLTQSGIQLASVSDCHLSQTLASAVSFNGCQGCFVGPNVYVEETFASAIRCQTALSGATCQQKRILIDGVDIVRAGRETALGVLNPQATACNGIAFEETEDAIINISNTKIIDARYIGIWQADKCKSITIDNCYIDGSNDLRAGEDPTTLGIQIGQNSLPIGDIENAEIRDTTIRNTALWGTYLARAGKVRLANNVFEDWDLSAPGESAVVGSWTEYVEVDNDNVFYPDSYHQPVLIEGSGGYRPSTRHALHDHFIHALDHTLLFSGVKPTVSGSLFTEIDFQVGDTILDTNIVANSGIASWHCTVSGNPGTWSPVYTIDGVPADTYLPVWSGSDNKATWRAWKPGNVLGPVASTVEAVPVWNNTDGTALKNSQVKINNNTDLFTSGSVAGNTLYGNSATISGTITATTNLIASSGELRVGIVDTAIGAGLVGIQTTSSGETFHMASLRGGEANHTSFSMVAKTSGPTINADHKVISLGHLSSTGVFTELAHLKGDGDLACSGELSVGNTGAATLTGNEPDGASAIGLILDTEFTYSTAGSKLLSVQNNGTEKCYVDRNGFARLSSSIRVSGDVGSGEGSTFTVTNATASASTTTSGVLGKTPAGIAAAPAGWIKTYVGATVAYIPYWTA